MIIIITGIILRRTEGGTLRHTINGTRARCSWDVAGTLARLAGVSITIILRNVLSLRMYVCLYV